MLFLTAIHPKRVQGFEVYWDDMLAAGVINFEGMDTAGSQQAATVPAAADGGGSKGGPGGAAGRHRRNPSGGAPNVGGVPSFGPSPSFLRYRTQCRLRIDSLPCNSTLRSCPTFALSFSLRGDPSLASMPKQKRIASIGRNAVR